jgi:hypothetical protein
MRFFRIVLALSFLMYGCTQQQRPAGQPKIKPNTLRIAHDESTGTLAVFRERAEAPVLTQMAGPTIRPYIHPIVAPDGKGVLTQFSPEHHRHQTGLYWGLKLVNGRDYFMNWQEDYWRKISARLLTENGERVQWQTVYELLDEARNPVLTETQRWSMQDYGETYVLDLEWTGEAQQDLTIGKFYVGGLFLRMPWQEGIAGEVINAAGQRNAEAEAQRAIWTDIGLQVEGREDLAHIAIFDHPDNDAFPTPWRVDNELGIGPSRQILGERRLARGAREVFRYRLVVYTGELNRTELNRLWKAYICETEY